jgi:hypothetical protein
MYGCISYHTQDTIHLHYHTVNTNDIIAVCRERYMIYFTTLYAQSARVFNGERLIRVVTIEL